MSRVQSLGFAFFLARVMRAHRVSWRVTSWSLSLSLSSPAIVAGLVRNGTVQTASLAMIYLVDIVLLCVLRPFSNSVVQWLETVLVR